MELCASLMEETGSPSSTCPTTRFTALCAKAQVCARRPFIAEGGGSRAERMAWYQWYNGGTNDWGRGVAPGGEDALEGVGVMALLEVRGLGKRFGGLDA